MLYSLATSHPGALVLHNYPQGLRRLHKKDDIFVDIASTDILRDLERGVPRYCAFRRRLGSGEVLSGIPGSPTDHHTAPYAMTEEFTAVYRMHSLLPD